MKNQKLFLSLLLCYPIFLLLVDTEGVHGSSPDDDHHHPPRKLFVFGDSYADTGNARNPAADSWKEPYGITWPGKPSGRFSDGLIFTDFFAKSLRLKSPIPYIWRRSGGSHLRYGMNFAFGGTGVFNTKAPYPNMTAQIDIFEGLLGGPVVTKQDLKHSLVHLSVVGNDYSYYIANGGSTEGLQAFIVKVVNQIVVNLERIYDLGVKKITVAALQPLGCLPFNTYPTSYQQCNSIFNNATQFHNLLLQQAIAKFNNQTSNSTTSSPFVTIIDFYKAFSTVIEAKGVPQSNLTFNEPLKPCCTGLNSTFSCGSVDANGNKMYNVCENPKSYLFWDNVHPTQAGWKAQMFYLKPTIEKLLHY